MTKHFHFSGVCGTAMGSLAVMMKHKGYHVTGSDQNVYPPMSTYLEENGIPVTEGYSAENLQPHPDFVILGNALSRGNPEVEYALKAHLHYLSAAEVLKNEFIRGNLSVVITGTHGKTTTTSLAAHVFEQSGFEPGFMIGGIPQNFGVSARASQEKGMFIIEGDEYDTSLFDKRSKFFHYLPDRLIINNIEFDHADIFNNLEEIKRAFTLMLRQMPADGLILANSDDPVAMEVAQKGFCPVLSIGFSKSADCRIKNLKALKEQAGMSFDLEHNNKTSQWSIPLYGEFNVRNAAMIIMLALKENAIPEKIQKGLDSFINTKRRLQELTTNKKVRVFDDFAHHPTAIGETIKALRAAYPDATLHAVYEPRSNTSIRNHHQDKMVDCFSEADTVTIANLHRGDSIPLKERLDIPKIIHELNESGKTAWHPESLEKIIAYAEQYTKESDIILFMSQGSFSGIPGIIAEKLDALWS